MLDANVLVLEDLRDDYGEALNPCSIAVLEGVNLLSQGTRAFVDERAVFALCRNHWSMKPNGLVVKALQKRGLIETHYHSQFLRLTQEGVVEHFSQRWRLFKPAPVSR